MADEYLQMEYKKLLEKRDNYKRYLEQSRKLYEKEMNKHIRILLYGGIVWVIAVIIVAFRSSYNNVMLEILVDDFFVQPVVIALIIGVFIFIRSGYHLFVMTRKANRVLGRIRIRRGIRDEIERLESEIWKIQIKIDEYEDNV